MGIRLIVEALDTPLTLTHREKLLLVVLAENANDETALIWDSIQSPEILQRAELSRTQLYEVLKDLVRKGALEKVSAGQRNGRAKYRITAQCPAQRDAEDQPQCPGRRDPDTAQRPAPRDTVGRFSVPADGTLTPAQRPAPRDFSVPSSGTPTPLPLKRDNSPAPRTTRAPAADPFDAFWEAYPRKVSKGHARTAWTKALKRGADPTAIVAAVRQHTAFWRSAATEPRFIPHPSTWLNGERWADELAPVTPQQPQQQTYADRGIF